MPQPNIALDHLVIAATNLEAGQAWARERLGVEVPRGGNHDHMATHNCVGRIGDDLYLEIIAINPDDIPDRPRWFSMDTVTFQSRLKTETAFLHHWAINTSNITETLTRATHDAGPVMTMSRGDLHWKIAIRDDGELPRHGIIPTIIEWPDGVHPARNMVALDLQLENLTIMTDSPERVTDELAAIGASELCTVTSSGQNKLTAHLTTNGKSLSVT